MARRDTWNGMNWLRPEKRIAIHIRDGWKCVYCGMCLKEVAKGVRQIDHLIPVACGGDNSAANLVSACAWCNNAKSDEPFTEFVGRAIQNRICRLIAKPLDMPRAKALLKLRKLMKAAMR